MKQLVLTGLALALSLSAGCTLTSDDGDNSDPTPIINTPERTDVSVSFTAPASYLVAKNIELGGVEATTTLFVGFGYDFSNPDDVSELYVPGPTGDFSYNVKDGELLVIGAFDPVAEDFIRAIPGYQGQVSNSQDVDLTPVSDATATMILSLSPDPANGIADEIQSFNLDNWVQSIGETQLVLEGSSRSDAVAANASTRLAAVDRLLVDGSDADGQFDQTVATYLEGSVWTADSASLELTFVDGGAIYTDSSNTEHAAIYDVVWSAGSASVDLTIDGLGSFNLDMTSVFNGNGEFDLMSQTFTRLVQ